MQPSASLSSEKALTDQTNELKAFIHNSDEQLLHAAKGGDHNAFRQLHDKYYDDLLRIAIAGTHDLNDAQDAVQECFIGLWKNVNDVKSTGNIGVYLYVALRNRIFTHFKQQKRKLEHLLRQPFEPVQTEEQIYSMIRTKELQQCIAEGITQLPERMKEIFLMHREQQMTIAEIAEQLGRSPQTIKNQLTDATQRVREHLRKNNLMMIWWLI